MAHGEGIAVPKPVGDGGATKELSGDEGGYTTPGARDGEIYIMAH